jgi:predicted amidohydrolase YtcJ
MLAYSLRVSQVLLAISLTIQLSACATRSVPVDMVVRNVTIYTGDSRASFVGRVAAKDGKIVAVTSGEITGTATQVIDGSGKFLTRALRDMHVHLRASECGGLDVATFPKRGVMSARDFGSHVGRVQQAQREEGIGPRIYSSYSTLNGKAFAHVSTCGQQ